MFPRVSALLPLRPLSRLPLCSGGPEVSAAAVVLLASPRGTVRSESLSPELVAAASAVADSLPLDKQMTKSELLRQLQQHEEGSRAQKDGARPKISFTDIISDMKVARSATARVNTRPVHQIQFDEGTDDFVGREKPADLRRSFRKNIFKGKRLNIFELKAVTEEAPETEAAPSLWDIEFAKKLAAVNEQPFQNGFEEMIQLTKEGKLWEFPINNEAVVTAHVTTAQYPRQAAGSRIFQPCSDATSSTCTPSCFDDDGSEFHEHIFLDKYLEDFPKQGPIRHFMELVTCGLSKNPYLSVKQKVEHIEWFRNYFNEKRDILKESGIQFN
ncbi:28S ribosomal protein S31, mitochondrial isoform X3 [Balaenoptera musculus]|uniref:Small ribosomal subunit protein mS31 n=1 Tax=Balaenoptera musculus TaxID=9771 RepID=A0A8B8VSQ8_BALMU|nr:28S ribosomal protein S31, mitochondrial isoform X3 [Balaenoptera musculus]